MGGGETLQSGESMMNGSMRRGDGRRELGSRGKSKREKNIYKNIYKMREEENGV